MRQRHERKGKKNISEKTIFESKFSFKKKKGKKKN
jgi:hypothetical protein